MKGRTCACRPTGDLIIPTWPDSGWAQGGQRASRNRDCEGRNIARLFGLRVCFSLRKHCEDKPASERFPKTDLRRWRKQGSLWDYMAKLEHDSVNTSVASASSSSSNASSSSGSAVSSSESESDEEGGATLEAGNSHQVTQQPSAHTDSAQLATPATPVNAGDSQPPTQQPPVDAGNSQLASISQVAATQPPVSAGNSQPPTQQQPTQIKAGSQAATQQSQVEKASKSGAGVEELEGDAAGSDACSSSSDNSACSSKSDSSDREDNQHASETDKKTDHAEARAALLCSSACFSVSAHCLMTRLKTRRNWTRCPWSVTTCNKPKKVTMKPGASSRTVSIICTRLACLFVWLFAGSCAAAYCPPGC